MTDDEKHHREKWMTDEQWYCAQIASVFCNGFHHILNLERCGKGIAIEMPGELGSYDFNGLTKAVVIAHDYCVRIGASSQTRTESFEGCDYGRSYLQMTFHARSMDADLKMFERHPPLADHIACIRASLPAVKREAS